MRTNSLSTALLALAAFPLAAADPALLDLLSPDSAVIAGMDIEKVRESPFGKYVFSTLSVSQSDLERFTQLVGFDPMKDLREVIIASPTADMKADALILIRGMFDQSKLTGVAGLQGAAIDSHQGFRILSPPKSASRGVAAMSIALLPGGLAVGPDAALRAALDRAAKGQSIGKDLAARVQRASAEHDAWVLTQVSPSKFAPRMRNQRTPEVAGGAGVDKLLNGSLFQGIENVTGGLRFGANVVVAGQATARSDQDASALGDVVKFLSSMVTSNAPADAPPALLTMLGTLQTSSEGRTFRFSMSAPQVELERLMNGRMGARMKPVNHR